MRYPARVLVERMTTAAEPAVGDAPAGAHHWRYGTVGDAVTAFDTIVAREARIPWFMVVGATGLAAWLSMIAALMAGWLVSTIAWVVTGDSFDPNLMSQLVGLGFLGAVVAGLWLSERVRPADAADYVGLPGSARPTGLLRRASAGRARSRSRLSHLHVVAEARITRVPTVREMTPMRVLVALPAPDVVRTTSAACRTSDQPRRWVRNTLRTAMPWGPTEKLARAIAATRTTTAANATNEPTRIAIGIGSPFAVSVASPSAATP